MKTSTRFKIVGIEVVGLGSFLLFLLVLELRSGKAEATVQTFGWDYLIVGVTLILIGLEILSLIKKLPVTKETGAIELQE